MSRLVALFIIACAFFASVTFTFASPVPAGELVNLEKRISHTGRGTWYYPGLGNCGGTNTQYEFVLAIGKRLYDRNRGGNCGQKVFIKNNANGKTAYGITVDSCQSCTDNDIDMSPALFKKLDSLDKGVIRVTWNFIKK